ncbi:MAG: HslU--HslV peptidase ATPase subunit, partial [Phycisphaerae bacterium]|nr:HslU--HslV peptidase ATPase subunit [Phycisphaerae bacterium]
LKVHDHTVTITRDDEVIEETTVDDPLAFVEDYQARFNAPDLEEKEIRIDAAYVREQLAEILKDEDVSRYIL